MYTEHYSFQWFQDHIFLLFLWHRHVLPYILTKKMAHSSASYLTHVPTLSWHSIWDSPGAQRIGKTRCLRRAGRFCSNLETLTWQAKQNRAFHGIIIIHCDHCGKHLLRTTLCLYIIGIHWDYKPCKVQPEVFVIWKGDGFAGSMDWFKWLKPHISMGKSMVSL